MTTPVLPVYCIVKVRVAMPPLAVTSTLLRLRLQTLLGQVNVPVPPSGTDIATVRFALRSASAPPKLVTVRLYVVVPDMVQAGGHWEAVLVGVLE